MYSVPQERIDSILKNTRWEHEVYEAKCLVTKAVLPNGFIIVTSSGCVDPRNFDINIGRECNVRYVTDKVWEMEGYKLTTEIHEILLNSNGTVNDLATFD